MPTTAIDSADVGLGSAPAATSCCDTPFPQHGRQILGPANRDLVDAYVRGQTPGAIPLRELTMAPTFRCNAHCRQCTEQCAMQDAGAAQLSLANILHIVGRLDELGVRIVKLHGGEPSVHPGFLPMLRAIHRTKVQTIYVSNNGMLLGTLVDSLASLRDKLLVRISLNAGTARTHQTVYCTPRPQFERILAGAAPLADRGVNLAFSTVVRPETAGEIAQAARHASQTGAGSITLKPLMDPQTKQLVWLPQPVRERIRRQIRAARGLESPGFRVLLSEALQVVLNADTPPVQPKEFRTCPFTFFRAVLSPPQPGVISTCPYQRKSRAHRLPAGADEVDRCWLSSAGRTAALAVADARIMCTHWCERGAMAGYLWAMRQQYRREGEAVLSQIPICRDQHGPFI